MHVHAWDFFCGVDFFFMRARARIPSFILLVMFCVVESDGYATRMN